MEKNNLAPAVTLQRSEALATDNDAEAVGRTSVRTASVPLLRGGAYDPDAMLAAFRRVASDQFGYSTLRPHQEEVLRAICQGKDLLAVLPTGSGKSLCYALPAAVRHGLVLVISPLIALMRDQVRRLRQQGLRVAALDSLQHADEKRQTWDAILAGDLQVLILSPERLAKPSFRARLAHLPIQLVAIDEAHCISHWGFHFRPEYRKVGEYLADFGDVQKIALTATATDRVRGEIRSVLRLNAAETVVADFRRENLRLEVATVSTVQDQLQGIVDAVRLTPGAGIVYASTRKQVVEIHQALLTSGQKAAVYHGGMPHDARMQSQRDFMSAKVRVMVATNAFGLGVDKTDIRFVFHASLPASIEQYVQEIGRAGRDGEAARCLLIAGSRDYYVQRYMIDKSFPEITTLKKAYDAARDLLGSTPSQSATVLLKHLSVALKCADDELRNCLEVLAREGLLIAIKAIPTAPSSSDDLYSMGLEGEDEKKFWREYPLRKNEQLNRLDKMRSYAAETHDRAEALNRYFNTR